MEEENIKNQMKIQKKDVVTVSSSFESVLLPQLGPFGDPTLNGQNVADVITDKRTQFSHAQTVDPSGLGPCLIRHT